MPNAMPDDKRHTSSPFSFLLRAGLTVLALLAAVVIVVQLIRITPGAEHAWKSALPHAGMSSAEAETAMQRAQSLHEAAVRPLLIEAGFISPQDVDYVRKPGYSYTRSLSDTLTAQLWNLRMFPELHDKLLQELLDTATPPKARALTLFKRTRFLDAMGKAIVKKGGYYSITKSVPSRADRNIFRDFNNTPECRTKPNGASANTASENTRDPAKRLADCKERLAFARTMLPVTLADITRDAEQRAAQEKSEREQAKASEKRYSYSESTAWDKTDPVSYERELVRAMQKALTALWEKNGDPAAISRITEAVSFAKHGTLTERYKAVPFMIKHPGLPFSEYTFWEKYRRDLSNVTSCVGTNPGSHVYLIGCCDTMGNIVQNQMKQSGTLVLDGWHGPGVSLTQVQNFTPKANLNGNLYLLADMEGALKDAPAYDMRRAKPIFAGMLFRYMERQPLVLPLNPADAQDAALLDWYADKGWQAGRTLLFSATGTPAEVARHWGGVHLIWWPSGAKHETKLGYLHPESRDFLYGLLPQVRDKAAARFLGPVTAMWFGRQTVDASGWGTEKFEARPESGLVPMRTYPAKLGGVAMPEDKPEPYSDATATISFGPDIKKSTREAFQHDFKIRTAKELERKYPSDATPKALFDFTASTIDQLEGWGFTLNSDMKPAVIALWSVRDNPFMMGKLTGILEQKNRSASSRVKDARKAVETSKKGK